MKNLKMYMTLLSVTLIAATQLSHAQSTIKTTSSAASQDEALCFEFDVQPYQKYFADSKGIDSLSFYPSIFNSPRKSRSKIYFVDHGVEHNPDAYNLVRCTLNASYYNCKGEDDSAQLGIYIDQKKAQLHLSFMILSDLDEDLRVLKPIGKKIISIPGKVLDCPKDSPEADLY